MYLTAMVRLAFALFFASALGLLAAPASVHKHGAGDVQNVRCPKFACFGYLTDSFKLPPIGYTKAYECSNGHMIYLR